MKTSTKYILVIGTFFVLFIHFLFTSIYVFQEPRIPGILRGMSNSYVIPFFHQNWKLFAPEMADYDVHLYVRARENGTWGIPFRISEKGNYHKTSKVTYMEYSIANSLANELAANMYWENGERNLSKVEQSLNYGRAIYFAERMCRRHFQIETDSIQLQLNFHFHPREKNAQQVQIAFSKTQLKK